MMIMRPPQHGQRRSGAGFSASLSASARERSDAGSSLARSCRARSMLRARRELAVYVQKFPQLKAEMKQRYEAIRPGPARTMLEHLFGHCQSKFYTACSRTRERWSSTVFAHELPPRSAGFDAENRLYLFALTVPLPLRLAPRCLARTRSRTRSGTPCQKPAAKGKKRCRLHGGAEGSGAPCGERNGSYRHGLYTREAIGERKVLQALIRGFRQDARGALSALDTSSGAKPSRARS